MVQVGKIDDAVAQQLAAIRAAGDCAKLVVPKRWKPECELRPYQRVGAIHLAAHMNYVLGDAVGTGKTPQEAYAWALLADQRPLRWLVVTTSSNVPQWAKEILKFLNDIQVFAIHSGWTPKRRAKTIQAWIDAGAYSSLVLSWAQLRVDWPLLGERVADWASQTHVTFDEAQRLMTPGSVTNVYGRKIAAAVDRCHGLTGTLMKNRPENAREVVDVICPGTMGAKYFEKRFCVVEKREVPQRGARGRKRMTNVVVDYRDLDVFRREINQVYLSREDDEIGDQRPEVTYMERAVELSGETARAYQKAELGLFLGNTYEDVFRLSEEQLASLLADHIRLPGALTHALQAASAPEIFAEEETNRVRLRAANPKLQAFVELLEDELQGEQVVVYCPYLRVLESYITALEEHAISYGRITGDDTSRQREEHIRRFREGEARVLCLTDAGGEGLNLQFASHLIMLSRPWDPGRYVQVVGRIRRFGSVFKRVTVWHLTSLDTADQYVDAVVADKFGHYEVLVRSGQEVFPGLVNVPLEVARKILAIRRALHARAV